MATRDDWVDKAEDDYAAALALRRRRTVPLHDTVCFHCQQCAEKYLKAYLVAGGATPPRIHDLTQLLRSCAVREAALLRWLPEARTLSQYAWLFRYPGASASRAEADEAVRMLRRVRGALRKRLGL